jgi:hypothetical protein
VVEERVGEVAHGWPSHVGARGQGRSRPILF